MKEKYLKEYIDLCLKYGFQIRGCGECGSAWLGELDEENKEYNQLVYERDFDGFFFSLQVCVKVFIVHRL